MNVGPPSSAGVRIAAAMLLSSAALIGASASASATPLAPDAGPSTLAASAVGPGVLAGGAPSIPAPVHDTGAAATADRAASATRYRALSDADAVAVGKRAFPDLVGRPGWEPLALPAGARIVDYRDADLTAGSARPAVRRSRSISPSSGI